MQALNYLLFMDIKQNVNVRQDPACKRRLHADSAHCLS